MGRVSDVNVLLSIQQMEIKLEHLYLELDHITHHINVYRTQIEELTKRTDLPSEFSDLKLSHEVLFDNLKNFKATVKSIHAELQAKLSSFEKKFTDIETEMSRHAFFIESLAASISLVETDVDQKMKAIFEGIHARSSTFEEKAYKKIEELKEAFISSPKEISDTNKRIIQKFEEAKQESENAIKLSRIFDRSYGKLEERISTLEKKLKE